MNNSLMQKGTASRSLIIMAFAVLILLLISFFPIPNEILTVDGIELSSAGRIAIGVLAFCLIAWIGEILPFHVTGLVGMILLAFMKTDSYSNIVALGFGNQIITFFIGVLCISSFISKSGLGKRICLLVLSKTGNKCSSIILGFLIAGTLLSMWVTDVAVAAILTPLAKSILEEEGLKPGKSNFAKALMITCAWGPLIGGIGTPAGCGPNPIAIGFAKEMAGIDISFLDWMLFGVPSAIALIFPSWWLLMKFFKFEITHLSRTKEELQQEYKNMPKPGREETITIIVFLITVVLWVSSDYLGKLIGISIPTSLPAMIGMCLFYMPGVTKIKWKEIQTDISWDSIILTVSGISLGMIIYNTGAAEWLAQILLGGIVTMKPIVQIFVIVLMISILKVALSSNTVTATVIIPIIIAIAMRYNIPMMGIIIPASLTLSLAFILVTSTPTSVIPYSTGYFSVTDMVKVGIVMTIITCFIITGVVFGIGLLRGMY